jgi:hypothetical protein
MMEVLKGVVMEIEDCAFPNVAGTLSLQYTSFSITAGVLA